MFSSLIPVPGLDLSGTTYIDCIFEGCTIRGKIEFCNFIRCTFYKCVFLGPTITMGFFEECVFVHGSFGHSTVFSQMRLSRCFGLHRNYNLHTVQVHKEGQAGLDMDLRNTPVPILERWASWERSTYFRQTTALRGLLLRPRSHPDRDISLGRLRRVSMPIELSPKVPAENSPLRYASIASKATRRLDLSENVKIEFDDGLESLCGGAVPKAVGQGVAPGGVFGLQGEQFGDGVMPSLRSGASVRRAAIADAGWRLLGLATSAISCLSFGVGEGVVTFRLTASGHGVFSVT